MNEVKSIDIKTKDLISSNIDTCKIFELVDSIQGLDTDSASPSESIIVKFREGVFFDDKEIKTGFLKIFFKDIKDKKGNYHDLDISKNRGALVYEQKIYELIRVLIRLNYCPYFVQIYSNAVNCSNKDFLNLINRQSDINDDLANKLYTRSLLHMIFQFEGKPSITDQNGLDLSIKEIMDNIFNHPWLNPMIKRHIKNLGISYKILQKNSRFNFIINEKIEGEKGHDIEYFYDIWPRRNKVSFNKFIHMILLQLFIAFYGLHLLKINHNDIHPGNFWITSVEPKIVKYKIEDEIYEFNNLGIEVKIYDFDYSYMSLVGNNPFLDKFMCEDFKVCNSFEPKRDLVLLIQKFRDVIKEIDDDNTKKLILSHIDNNIMIGKLRKKYKDEDKDIDEEYDEDDKDVDVNLIYYNNNDKIKEPLELVKQQLSVVGAKKINISKNCPYKKKNKKLCNEPVVEGRIYCKAHDEKKGEDQYDYSITKHKAELISKLYKLLLAVFNSKIGSTSFKKAIVSKCREKTKQLFGDDAPKKEREEFLKEVSRTIEGREKSISKDELEQMCDLI